MILLLVASEVGSGFYGSSSSEGKERSKCVEECEDIPEGRHVGLQKGPSTEFSFMLVFVHFEVAVLRIGVIALQSFVAP